MPRDTDTAEAIDRLTERIEQLESSLRGEMAGMRDELRRHTDVVAESLRDDIRLFAEGVAHLAVKIDRIAH